MRFAVPPWLLFLTIVLVGGGCHSGQRAERVWGTASYDGQPIDNGTIELIPLDGTAGPATGAAIVGGRFEIPAAKGARAGGKYKVAITATRDSGKTAPNIFKPGEAPLTIGEQYLPPRYNSESKLTITISADAAQNEQNFALISAAVPPGAKKPD